MRFWREGFLQTECGCEPQGEDKGQELFEFPIRNELGQFFKKLENAGYKAVMVEITPGDWTLSVYGEKMEG